MGVTDIIKNAYDLYKKDIISGVLFSLATMVLGILIFIPVIGAIIYSFLFPRLLVWYYQKVSQEKLTPKYNVSFISLFIPTLIVSIGSIIMLAFSFYTIYYLYLGSNYGVNAPTTLINPALSSVFIIGSIIVIVGFILYILSLYSFFGSLFGKVDKYTLNFNKSITIFGYILLIGIIIYIVYFVLTLIFSLITPYLGELIGFIFLILVGAEMEYLVPMLVTKNL